MSDIVITTTSVKQGTNALVRNVVVGATVTAGMVLYLNKVDSKYYKAVNTVTPDLDGNLTYNIAGIALAGGTNGQTVPMQYGGQIFIGATVTLALEYYLSATAGGICGIGDVASGHEAVRIGYADTTTTLTFDMQILGTTP